MPIQEENRKVAGRCRGAQMVVRFPYPEVPDLRLPDGLRARRFQLPEIPAPRPGGQVVEQALAAPIGAPRLRELARGRRKVLIVSDDLTRPTPVHRFIGSILRELKQAGVTAGGIRFIMALGTHRPMTRAEMREKLGLEVVEGYEVLNHDWTDPDRLEYLGDTEQGEPVWINREVRRSDLVIGLGAIMPIDICGFTGGGKALVPGLSGEATIDAVHWTRVGLPSCQVLGRADNPIRASIDTLARKAGLDFIVNVVLNGGGEIVGAVAGDMVRAHRAGCETARTVFGVEVPREYDIVVADSHPFDIEFWQANKALDTAGEFVRPGGVVILVSPCTEGLSRTHAAEILRTGYPDVETIKQMVSTGVIRRKVVGLHMVQVSSVAVEKARLVLVSTGISRSEAERMGFSWAQTPQAALEQAMRKVPEGPQIAVLRGAAQMLALKGPADD